MTALRYVTCSLSIRFLLLIPSSFSSLSCLPPAFHFLVIHHPSSFNFCSTSVYYLFFFFSCFVLCLSVFSPKWSYTSHSPLNVTVTLYLAATTVCQLLAGSWVIGPKYSELCAHVLAMTNMWEPTHVNNIKDMSFFFLFIPTAWGKRHSVNPWWYTGVSDLWDSTEWLGLSRPGSQRQGQSVQGKPHRLGHLCEIHYQWRCC